MILENYLFINKNKCIVSQRNFGIDLLKIFSMINIINLHINKNSHYLRVSKNDIKYKKIYRLESFSFLPVNAFGLISGFIGYKKFKFSNLIYLWFENAFYSIIMAFYYFIKSRVNIKYLLLSFLPIGMKKFWYFNAYFFMYLLLPFITLAMNHIDKNLFTRLVYFYYFMYSFYYIFFDYMNNNHDFAFINHGYTSIWLIILYLIGAFCGRFYHNKKKYSNIFWLIIYLSSSIITSEFIFINLKNLNIPNKLFLNYYSPTIIIQALSLLFLFNNIKIKSRLSIQIIKFLNPLNFNIVLIHTYIFNSKTYVTIKFFDYIKALNPNFLFFKIYFISSLVYIFCAMLDYLRSIIFKVLRIRYLCISIDNKVFDKNVH